MNVTCTIITANYIHYALALNESLLKFHKIELYILIVDQKIDESTIKDMFPNIHFLYLEDINTTEIAQKIISKYQRVYEDALRWSLKPILINYLFSIYKKVLFLDCDLYFYNDYQFLFNELDSNDVTLTPHWRNVFPNPSSEYETINFNALFYCGLFNAGFIGVNKNATHIMDWWAICCEYKCVKKPSDGCFVDQTYLNLMPIYFDNVKILSHRGCNVSEWNYIECKRTKLEDEVLINNQYPIIFIHFYNLLINDIKGGKDYLLSNHLKIWETSIEKFTIIMNSINIVKSQKKYISALEQNNTIIKKKSIFKIIKETLRIRTRIRRFLQG